MDKYTEAYHKSAIFRLYVERYAEQHTITPEEALRHKIVQNVGDRYIESEVRNDGCRNQTIH